ncbi:MAG: hypothetical protein P1U90_17870 [Akkermansiaceae bacterium]|nr:hypothetical protein [Akkermansiaceae bacterium]
MKIILTSLIVFIAITPFGYASHWGSITVPEITLKHPEASVTVKADKKSGQLEVITVTFGTEIIQVPKSELDGIGPIDTSSARIVTAFGHGNLESRSKLTDHLFVVFEFESAAYHIDEDLERVVAVYPTARFEFKSSKYTRRYVMKPAGNYKNKWKLFEKDPGEKEISDGKLESVYPPGP